MSCSVKDNHNRQGNSGSSTAVWILIAAGVLLGASGMLLSGAGDRGAVAADAAGRASVKWISDTPSNSDTSVQHEAAAPALAQMAGLRLGIDETQTPDPVREAVNEADSRLNSLIQRHDRLAEMVQDLLDSGIDFTVQVDDLVPDARPAQNIGKPKVLDSGDSNRRHPLFTFVSDLRNELSTAIQEPADSAAARIDIVDARLDTLAIRQFGVLDRIEKEVEGRHRRLASVPRALGIELPGQGGSDDALGGPLVPLSGTRAAIYAFETRMEAAELTLARLSDIGRIVQRLPVRRPVGTQASISSGFGPRTDPFLGKPAMHQGLDFRAGKGEQVMAAGAGTVLSAGRHGGYGNMVEIDHGQGLTSRYAHLSKVVVKKGDTVTPGQLIGKVGSTGRSTGPHLHFEVRRNGAARNPLTYIRAGRQL